MKSVINEIRECAALLASVGELFWSEKLHCFANSTKSKLSSYEIDEILSWYGGMGSFSDVYISPYNNHTISEEQVNIVNSKLSKLRDSIYDSLKQAKRVK